MNMEKKLCLKDLLLLIDKPNRFSCLSLLEGYHDIIETAPGSLTKHQAWIGGYKDHLEETMNFAIWLYNLMNERRELPFTISDCLLVLFFHDIEKPFKYHPKKMMFLETEAEKWEFLQKMVRQYDLILTDDHWNALKYIHGEGHDYNATERIQRELAAFCHICDTASARIWYNYPEAIERRREIPEIT
jgi:hypothetical protein